MATPTPTPAAPKTPGILERLNALEQTLNALEQTLNALEQTLNGLASFTQQELGQVKQTITNLVEVLNGVISASGEEFSTKVQDAITDSQKKRATEQADREKVLLDQLVETGALVTAQTVGENSVVVGREYSGTGEVLGAGRVQVRFSQFTPDAKAKLIGQAPGFLLEVETGKFEVLEVFDPAPPKAETPPDAATADTATAPAEAATVAE